MLRSCPGAGIIKEIRPEFVICPKCQAESEIWSDEFRVRCECCSEWVYRPQKPTCLDWCAGAERCVSPQVLAAYRKARQTK